jgi:hypothetical protein
MFGGGFSSNGEKTMKNFTKATIIALTIAILGAVAFIAAASYTMKSNSTQIIYVKPTPTPTATPTASPQPNQATLTLTANTDAEHNIYVGQELILTAKVSDNTAGMTVQFYREPVTASSGDTLLGSAVTNNQGIATLNLGVVADPGNGYNLGVYSTINVYATATHP